MLEMRRFLHTIAVGIPALLLNPCTIEAAEPGTHFIVLIDDSGDMAKHRDLIVEQVPRLLFGLDGTRTGPDAAPVFDPVKDTLSLGFFGITKGNRPASCLNSQLTTRSLAPGDLLEWVPPGTPSRTADELQSGLERLIAPNTRRNPTGASRPDCRLRHEFSPISTAMLLSLPAVNRILDNQAQFGRVVIVTVSNYISNVNPSVEIPYFAAHAFAENAEAATAAAHAVQSAFAFNGPSNWFYSWNTSWAAGFATMNREDGLRVQFTEATPADGDPDGLYDAPGSIVLERASVSPFWLMLADRDGGNTKANVRSTRFQPTQMLVQTANASRSLNLTVCPEVCHQTEAGLSVDLLALLGLQTWFPPGDAPPVPSRVTTRVGFRYETGVYDHLVRTTRPHVLSIAKVPALDALPEERLYAPVEAIYRLIYQQAPMPPVDFKDDSVLLQVRGNEEGDRKITQDDARVRILQSREYLRQSIDTLYIPAGIAIIALVAAVLIHVARRRRFRPDLRWTAVEGVAIDFTSPPRTPILVGTIEVRNFARRIPLGSKDEPHFDATFEAQLAESKPNVLMLAAAQRPPVGFVNTAVPENIVPVLQQRLADRALIAVFLDPRVIGDCLAEDCSQPASIGFEGHIKALWKRNRTLEAKVRVPITLQPEAPMRPMIGFIPVQDSLYYQGGGAVSPPPRVAIGRFTFKSQAAHEFAIPFQETYALSAEGPLGPLADGAIVLDDADVVLASGETVERQVWLVCDGNTIRNPEGDADVYRFRLAGSCDPNGSQIGFHYIKVQRDPTLCDVTCQLSARGKTWDIAWDERSGEPKSRLVTDGVMPLAFSSPLADGTFQLDTLDACFDSSSPSLELAEIKVGNSGAAGRGRVTARFETDIWLSEDYRDAITWEDGVERFRCADESDHTLEPVVSITEGQLPRSVRVELCTRAIDSIPSAVLKPDDAIAQVTITFDVETDTGSHIRRWLKLAIPLRLEQLADQNWLCIDFGTSAIAAAYGHETNVTLLPLQLVRQGPDENPRTSPNLEEYDQHNIERGSALVPSFIACDADLRTPLQPDDIQRRPGFPGFRQASFDPSKPAFVSLPATSGQMKDIPGRVIFALKSWIGMSVDNVVLRDRVTIVKTNKKEQVKTRHLPLNSLIEASFSALADAYLKPDVSKVGQIVLTHPNTFTPLHCERLHTNAAKALSRYFDLKLYERIHMLSESDAVAYYHCLARHRRGVPPGGTENIFVYDLGAGTLDVSVIRVEWSSGIAIYPKRWQGLYRLGVPVAGNHIDSILARIVHQALSDPKYLDPDVFDYHYPVVASRALAGTEDGKKHASASHSLWTSIRKAKQGGNGRPPWSGTTPLQIQVASLSGTLGDVWPVLLKDPLLAPFDSRLRQPPAENSFGLFQREGDGGDALWLQVPAAAIREFPAMRAFTDFIIGDVIDEALAGAGISAQEVSTLLISGRGVLWPGLRDRVRERFPDSTDAPDLHGEDEGSMMKEAVVRGAIAWQGLRVTPEPPPALPLAVVLHPSEQMIPEANWADAPIRLDGSNSFDLVQIALRNPDPDRDYRGLRKHFYLSLTSDSYRTATLWAKDPNLVITSERPPGGALKIHIGNSTNPSCVTLSADGQWAGGDSVIPPWPIGEPVLHPEE